MKDTLRTQACFEPASMGREGVKLLERLSITREPPPLKEADKVKLAWTSIKEKPLKCFWILTGFQANRAKRSTILPAKEK